MNKKAAKAWEIYLTMETSSESYQLLLLIANESFKVYNNNISLIDDKNSLF